MKITIDKSAAEPVYLQIQRQIAQLVRDGLLAAGSKIPSVRELARQLGVSQKTVYTAYEWLAAESVIETRHGSGTYITQQTGVVSGTNLGTQEEMSGPISGLPPMRWEPFDFQSDFFVVPPSKGSGELLRFSIGNPDPALFPFERIKQVATNMLWYPQEYFFEYGNPQGFQPLVQYLEKEMALLGAAMSEGENDIILTGGFQRGLSLVLDRIVKPGQKVIVESPTYSSVLNLLIAKELVPVPIPVDGEGMDTEYLASVLNQGEARVIITVPTYHNPTGACMSQARREHLLRLAAKHRVPIIEDDWARLLRYDGEVVPPLKSLDSGGYVIHIGTFSKCLLPGLRIGWITCPTGLALPLVRSKRAVDKGDSFFMQALLYEFIQRGHFARHLRTTIKEYKRRRNLMCKTLKDHLPAGCTFKVPNGGFTVWVELPAPLRSLPMLTLARRAGVDFLPACFCMPDRRDVLPGGGSALRLAFSRTPADKIESGVKTLCGVIQDCLDHPEKLEDGASSFDDLYR